MQNCRHMHMHMQQKYIWGVQKATLAIVLSLLSPVVLLLEDYVEASDTGDSFKSSEPSSSTSRRLR